MLLEFRTKNYKSFYDELVFSMIPAPKQKELEDSILKEKINNKEYKVLCSAIIYGANAAGKTNIIGAMDTFKNIILRGHIRNDHTVNTANIASKLLELIPNSNRSTVMPVEFYIKFIEQEMLIEYGLALELGLFLDTNYSRKIVNEFLYVNGELIFKRNENLKIENLETIPFFQENQAELILDSLSLLTAIAESNLDKEELFLVNGFKNLFSNQLSDFITTWTKDKWQVIYHTGTLRTSDHFKEADDPIYIATVAKIFGVNANAVGYISDDEIKDAKLYSFFNAKSPAVPAEAFESYGTIRFIHLFPVIADTLKSGGTLVVDEFDASLHPKVLMNLINIFHNKEINIKNAQLIFNTHNPLFLNSNLFRRDEIKFVERENKNHHSTHYSLSDFGTSGESAVRKGEDYMKKYFIHRYGAIKDIDFSDIFLLITTANKGNM